MGYILCYRRRCDKHSITAVDNCTLLKAKGGAWHKSSMKKGIKLMFLALTLNARWGYSHTKGWIFGYKLHLTCTTDKIIVPLTADVTTANVTRQ